MFLHMPVSMPWCPRDRSGLDVRERVRQKAEALGAAGARWLARLPEVIGELESIGRS